MTALVALNNGIHFHLNRDQHPASWDDIENELLARQSQGTAPKEHRCTHSRWKATPKCKQQLGRSLNANLPPEQRPYEIGFLAQKAQPGLAIGSKSEIGVPLVAFGNLQLFASNRDCCFHFVMTGEREVIDCVKTF